MEPGECAAGDSLWGASLDESEDAGEEEGAGGDPVWAVRHKGEGLRQDHQAAVVGGAEYRPFSILIELLRDSTGGGPAGSAEEDAGAEPCQADLSQPDHIVPVEVHEELMMMIYFSANLLNQC